MTISLRSGDFAEINERVGDPAAVANSGLIYVKDVLGVSQLFYRADDGTVSQVTPGGGGMSIGGTVTGGTTGSVLFVGAGPVLAQDNANFFWDDTTDRLGLGLTAPQARLHLRESGVAVVGLNADTMVVFQDSGVAADTLSVHFVYGNASGFANLVFGTSATPVSGTLRHRSDAPFPRFEFENGGTLYMTLADQLILNDTTMATPALRFTSASDGIDYSTIAPAGMTFIHSPGNNEYVRLTNDYIRYSNNGKIWRPDTGDLAIQDSAGAFIITFSNPLTTLGAAIRLQINAGTVASPSLTIAADNDTGLFQAAGNTLSIAIAAEEGMRISDPASGETALLIRRNVGGVFSLERVSMGAADSGGAGFKLLRVPN